METSPSNKVKAPLDLKTPRARVQVRAVHVDLAAALVRDAREVRDRLLEDAVRAGVRDHDRRQVVLVFFGLRFKIVEVDVAVFIRFHLCACEVNMSCRWREARVDGATEA